MYFVFWFPDEEIEYQSKQKFHCVVLLASFWTGSAVFWCQQRKSDEHQASKRVTGQNNTDWTLFRSMQNAVFSYCTDDSFRWSFNCWKIMEVGSKPWSHSWSLKRATSRPTVWDYRWSSANTITLSPGSTWKVRDTTLICPLLNWSLISNPAHSSTNYLVFVCFNCAQFKYWFVNRNYSIISNLETN